MHYIGLDHHRKFTQVAVVNSDDAIVLEMRMPNTLEAIEDLLKRLEESSQAVVEAGPSWGWIYDTFQKLGVSITLANPLQVRLIAETRCKTDRRDALTLARLLRVGWIPKVHVGDPASRLEKQLWRERVWLVRMQTRLKNRIRRLLDHYHIALPDVTDLFGSSGQTFLNAVELPGPAQQILHTQRRLLATYKEAIRDVQAIAQAATAHHPEVTFLKSLPGFGETFAPIAALEIGDVSRFPDAAHLAAYCGLVPSVSSSGGITHRGDTGPGGNHWLKWVFIEASWIAIRSMPSLRLRFDRIKQRRGSKIAIVACARHLCEISFSLLKHQRCFQERPLVYA
jgi:transposase